MKMTTILGVVLAGSLTLMISSVFMKEAERRDIHAAWDTISNTRDRVLVNAEVIYDENETQRRREAAVHYAINNVDHCLAAFERVHDLDYHRRTTCYEGLFPEIFGDE